MEEKVDLAIITPLCNPHANWEKSFTESVTLINDLFSDINFRIIIVNDGGTTDITGQIDTLTNSFSHLKYLYYKKNKGKGFAIKTGLKNISAKHYIYTDWDFPFGGQILLTFYNHLITEDYDIILAKRTKKYCEVLPLERRLISSSLKLISSSFFRLKKYDTQAGLKGINNNGKKVLLDTKSNSFIFEFEFIRSSIRKKLRLFDVEVTPKPSIVFTNFSFKVLMNELKTFFKIIFYG